jgi:phage tail tube protein FII
MSKLYMLVACDVRRGGEAGSARPNLIAKMALPPIKLMTANHNPGGGVGSVDWTLPRIEPVEPKYEAKGVDDDIFRGFGVRDKWVFSSAYRDQQSGKIVPARCIIEGAITEWEPDEASPEEYQGCNHMFKEVTHYEFRFNGKEKWYWDFFERELRIDGKDYMKEIKRALG